MKNQEEGHFFNAKNFFTGHLPALSTLPQKHSGRAGPRPPVSTEPSAITPAGKSTRVLTTL